MKCIDRKGSIVKQNETQNKVLSFLYQTKIGRMILMVLVRPEISRGIGFILNLPVTRVIIPYFVRKNHINVEEYEKRKYTSFNDFFIRKIMKERRIIDKQFNHFISPCDAKLSVFPINQDSQFTIKDSIYTIESLFRSKKLAKRYEDGILLLFRLTVDDYHRYCYIDNGIKTKNWHIPGVFHTVNPLAGKIFPIYKENTREFSILKSENYGNILIMEVGALLVGKIANYHEEAKVNRGEEKGRFEFGGSTIIVCLEKGKVKIDTDILYNSLNDIETVVKMGEKIGEKIEEKIEEPII